MTRLVSVRLFARLRELAGAEFIRVELPAAATVRTLRATLADALPPAAELLRRCAVSANSEYVDDDCLIDFAAEVAVIPPVSGGSR